MKFWLVRPQPRPSSSATDEVGVMVVPGAQQVSAEARAWATSAMFPSDTWHHVEVLIGARNPSY